MLHDLCFMLLLMLAGLAPAVGLALLRLWSRTRPTTVSFPHPERAALLQALDARLGAVGLARAGATTLPVVYAPNPLRRGLGALPVTVTWAPPDRATLAGPRRVVANAAGHFPGARLEASSEPWVYARTARRVGLAGLALLVGLGVTLVALWGIDQAQRRPDGTSPKDVVVALRLSPAEARESFQRNLWVEETGRFVFVTSPGGLVDGQRLSFPRKGRTDRLTRAGDLTVVVEVK